jgi:hypothetical protein
MEDFVFLSSKQIFRGGLGFCNEEAVDERRTREKANQSKCAQVQGRPCPRPVGGNLQPAEREHLPGSSADDPVEGVGVRLDRFARCIVPEQRAYLSSKAS